MPPLLFVRCSHSAGDGAADGGVMGDSKNNMDNTRTTSSLATREGLTPLNMSH